MTIFICGPGKSDKPGYGKCICCFKDFPFEAMATSTCWECVTGSFDCQQCYDRGVPVDRFSYKQGKLHCVREWIYQGETIISSNFFSFDGPYIDDNFDIIPGFAITVVTVCGEKIPYGDVGQGTAVRKPCKKCWPEGF